MKRYLSYAIFILAFFIIGVVLANFIIMPVIVRMGQEVAVPNVCNLPLDSAVLVLKTRGLQGVVKERRYDQVIDEGRVIIQDPLPDAKVKKNRIVNLSVSLGVETVDLPFLFGIEFEKGRLILENLGLEIEAVDSAASDTVPAGKIIQTAPEFESPVKTGDRIRVIVSKGRVVKMPNLVGLPLAQADSVVRSLRLVLRETQEMEGSGVKGSVIVQTPEPGQLVRAGDSVAIIIIK